MLKYARGEKIMKKEQIIEEQCHCGCGCDDCIDEGFERDFIEMPTIGSRAPYFEAITSNGPIVFPNDYAGKWVVFFSHPADFTPVCTTEFMTFQSRAKEFKALNCELLGLSIDSLHSHIAWINQIEKYQYKEIKNQKIEFPVIADINQDVASLYNMVHPNVSDTNAIRAVFIIDPESIIRTILYYPSSTGRNFDEIIRIIKALQTADKEACATPADWQPGEDVIVPPASTIDVARKRLANPKEFSQCQDWFLCFKKTNSKK